MKWIRNKLLIVQIRILGFKSDPNSKYNDDDEHDDDENDDEHDDEHDEHNDVPYDVMSSDGKGREVCCYRIKRSKQVPNEVS